MALSDRTRRRSRTAFGWALLAAVICGTALIGCSSDDETTGPAIRRPRDFLPPGTESMPRDGAPREATDTDGLRLIVNGGFQVYTDHGYREIAEQMYAGTVGQESATVRVWIVDVASAENAEALNEELRQIGTWQDAGEVGDQDHRRTALTGYTVLMRRGAFSVQIDVSLSSQDAQDLAVLFATHIDGEIQG